jgi:hypothetical protein
MKCRKRGGEFQAGVKLGRSEMNPIRDCGFERATTHSQGLEGHVYPPDGLRKCGVITGKVGDDAARCGSYEAGCGDLNGGILFWQPRK